MSFARTTSVIVPADPPFLGVTVAVQVVDVFRVMVRVHGSRPGWRTTSLGVVASGSAVRAVTTSALPRVAVATDGDELLPRLADHILWVPETPWMLSPVTTTIPLQLLAYQIAVLRGADIDQPRNLAKSVTVE